MKTEHTPEPWEWSKHKFNSQPFEGTLEQECGIYPPLGESGPVAIASGEADARRIVACVNACAGISTENLEDNKPLIELAMAYNVALRQRDELLNTGSAVVERWDSPLWKDLPHTGEYIHRLREAIASVKEK